MNGRVLVLGSAVAVGLVVLVAWRRAGASIADAAADPGRATDHFDDLVTDTIIFPAENMTMTWKTELTSGRGEAYAGLFAAAEAANGLPPFLLARLAWQESHYRPDIISGQVKSAAGALGIMQIVPRWHPDVDPLDPVAAINYAAKYLKSLYRQFGTWSLALMAYNWGPGNVAKWLKSGGTVPTETMNYQAQIVADVRAFAPAVAWA